MSTMHRHRWFLAAPALLLLAAAVAWRFQQGVEADWRDMLAQGRAIEEREQRQDHRRPVLWGDVLPGNAFPDYRASIALVSSQSDLPAKRARLERAESADEFAAAMADYLPAVRPAFELLRRGAHRPTARREISWGRDLQDTPKDLFGGRALVHAVVVEARHLAARDRPLDAAHLLLDGMQLLRDMVNSPFSGEESFACWWLGETTRVLCKDSPAGVLIDNLSPSALRALDDGMRRLDEGLPTGRPSLRTTVALFVRGVSEPGRRPRHWNLPSWLSTWRYGFSQQSMFAGFVRERAEQAQRLEATANLSWAERRCVHDELMQAQEDSPNPLVRKWAFSVVSSRVAARACLRLARAAVGYRLRGEVPVLEDPFGTTLRWERNGHSLEIWSLGGDARGRAGPNPLAIELGATR